MRLKLTVPNSSAMAGMELAAQRFATALFEAGHDVEVLYGSGPPPALPAGISLTRLQTLSPGTEQSPPAIDRLRDALAKGSPDAVIVTNGEPEQLYAAGSVARTMYLAQDLAAICPDAGKYWRTLRRPCAVEAGHKCILLRPLLRCNASRATTRLELVARYRRHVGILREGAIGVCTPSTDTRRRFLGQGVPAIRLTTVPNLPMRWAPAALERAAAAVPCSDRGAVTFIGRLAHAKGADLLPELRRRLPSSTPMHVYGAGYLDQYLRRFLGGAMRGTVSQAEIAGSLMWSRGLVFLSMWPEPGGIVALDAQLFGVPLACFAAGAALDWPYAVLLPRSRIDQVADWAAALEASERTRDAELVAARLDAFWQLAGGLFLRRLTEFVRDGAWREESDNPTLSCLQTVVATTRPAPASAAGGRGA